MRTQLAAFVVLVAAFLASHPYLEGAGLCGHGGCPEATQSSHAAHAASSAGCVAAVLAAAGGATVAFFASFGLGRSPRQRRPAEAFLPPDPPPPRAALAPLGH